MEAGAEWVRAALSTLGLPDVRSVASIAGGSLAGQVWSVNQADHLFALRVYAPGRGAAKEREAAVLHMADRSGLPVPRVRTTKGLAWAGAAPHRLGAPAERYWRSLWRIRTRRTHSVGLFGPPTQPSTRRPHRPRCRPGAARDAAVLRMGRRVHVRGPSREGRSLIAAAHPALKVAPAAADMTSHAADAFTLPARDAREAQVCDRHHDPADAERQALRRRHVTVGRRHAALAEELPEQQGDDDQPDRGAGEPDDDE